jgi:competence ComEA-like helix-hairpin-helix protein
MSVMRVFGRVAPVAAVIGVVLSMGGTWNTATASPTTSTTQPTPAAAPPPKPEPPAKKSAGKQLALAGKLNLNTASEEQLMQLPTIGPSKAERIVTWRKKNGGFKRVADLRRVKGFGYKTFKRLEPFLDVKGDTTLTKK